MEIAQEKRGAVFVLGPVGRLDTDSAADLELALQDLLATNATHFVVDLAQINYVSSAGLRVLLMLAKSVDDKGSLRLSGLNPQVRQVFDIAGFTKLFRIYPDRDAALRDHPAVGIEDAAPAAPAARESTPAPPREAAAPVAARPPAASAPPEPSQERPPKPAPVSAPVPVSASSVPREAPAERPVASTPERAPAPEPVRVPAPAPTLSDHAARLLGVGPAANASFDPSVTSLGRHAAMLLGVELDGARSAAPKAGSPKSSAPKAVPPKPARPAPAAPAGEPDEKGGLLSRLFGRKKRSNL